MADAVAKLRKSGRGYKAEEDKPPFKYLDPERYNEVERLVAANTRMSPSITRYRALCGILSRGFKAAYMPPVDMDLASRNWLPACLEMMTANPLLSPGNDWKTTLTIPDAQLVVPAFVKAVTNMIRWADAVKQTEPLADIDEWGGLVAAIYRTFIIGHEVFDDGEWKAKFTDKMILRENGSGNLNIDDRNICSILSVCEVQNAVGKYMESQIPKESFVEVDCGNTALEFDHDFICQMTDGVLRICHEEMVERIKMHDGTENLAERRAALSFTSGKNTWFDYYAKEYCAPAKWHLTMSHDKGIEEADLPTNFGIIDNNSRYMCQLLVDDTGGSELAMQVKEEWEDICAIFATRCLGKTMPSFSEQTSFCIKLSAFMENFAKAADSIGRTLSQKSVEKSAATEPTIQDVFAKLTKNSDLLEAIYKKVSDSQKPDASIEQDKVAPKAPSVTTGKQIAQHRKLCGYILTALEQWRQMKKAELIRDKYANGIVRPPATRVLKDMINKAHAGEEGWQPLNESIVRRHLENALGMKIGDTKYAISPGSHNRPAFSEKRRKQILKNAPTHVVPEVCLYWAALSLRLKKFALAQAREITVNTRLKTSEQVFIEAVRQAGQLWTY